MGVPKFYRYISERYPCLSEVVREYQIPEFDNLYLDMNGIIHNCSHPNDEDVHFRISEEKIFQDIFRYIEFLFRMIKPRKVFFMAIDGVAPRAKMNQQRGRRFRSAKEAETRELEAKEKGEKLPEEARFDSNCITPGTPFMDRLHQHLKYFVTNKISTDDLWRDVKVILSGHETPGEGEHKVMDFIRYEKSQPFYDPNTRHCLYGLDADLIMLGMCSHEPHFSLLREEVKYIRSKTEKNKRDSNPEAITFHLLHLSLFREYIDHEFEELKTCLSFGYNLENIIDDWVLMGFLVGNDFIPHIPHFHINKSSLLKLYDIYKKVLPTLDGYLNEDGKLNLFRFQKYLNELRNLDIDNFSDTYADLRYFESKTGRKLNKPEEDCAAAAKSTCDLIPDNEVLIELSDDDEVDEIYESSDSDMFMDEFTSHKKDYYMTKLNYKHVDESVLKEQAYEYIRAIQWNLHYYYNGCMSWSWYYPHHYAPYISDVNNFVDIDLTYDMGEPFKPFEQLLAVLPAASKDLLPKAFEPLVTNPNSKLIDYYPEDFETDMNEKQQAWEAVVLIPFIDEKRLLDAVKELELRLSPDEVKRNRHGPHLVFTYTDQQLERFISPNRTIFPDISINHAKCTELDTNGFRIPIEDIHKGLSNGVELEIYFPGFPTLQHIPHKAILKKERVRVFESASMGENTMLVIDNDTQYDIDDIAKNYLNKTVFINWPHLLEAKVFQVSNGDFKYTLNDKNRVVCEEVQSQEYSENCLKINAIIKKCKERWGIIVGQPDVVLHVYPMTGRKYVHGVKGRVTLEKQWSMFPMLCPIQLVVKDLNTYEHTFRQFQTIDEMYPKGSKCFPVDNPYYGSEARVIECNSKTGYISVEVFPKLEPDMREIQDRAHEIIHEHYVPNYVLSQRLGISGHLLSRITGTIFVLPLNEKQRKINIGLNLKFNQRNEEIPGFSIKRDDNWLFSDKIFKIMEEYLTRFPFIFEKLSSCVDKDFFTVNDLIPGENKQKILDMIQNWLRSLPSASEKRQKCNAEILDEFIVEAIEDVINTHIVFPKEIPSVIETYKPSQLFRPIHYLGYSLPDPKATFSLFDRVVNIRSGISVPLGAKGTIIGVNLDETNEVNTLYDIVFDEEFVGGLVLRCSPGKGYKLSPANLINITYGLKISGKYEQFVNCGQAIQTRPQLNRYQQNNRQREPNPSFGGPPGQRMARRQPATAPFVTPNVPNTQTAISIQTINHSQTSPFQSPKHESHKNEDFPPMADLWDALKKGTVNDKKLLPKQSFAAALAGNKDNLVTNVPNQSNDRNKSNPKPRPQKITQDNRRAESIPQNSHKSIPYKSNIQLIESYRSILTNACDRYYKLNARYETVTYGPMKAKYLKMTLPDNVTFQTLHNEHNNIEDASEFLAFEALKHINHMFNANIDLQRPKKLLPSPSFVIPNQSSPNRPRLDASSLPRPPLNWIKNNRPMNQPFARPLPAAAPHIPESFVEQNERLYQELQKRNVPSKANINTSLNKERNIPPKKLFDTKNDNIVNLTPDPKTTQYKIMRKTQNDGINDTSTHRQRHTPTNQSAFDHQFVPLQVARNNQSHRHVTPQKNTPSKPRPDFAKDVIEINSNSSSSEVEILTPETMTQFGSKSSFGTKVDDEIEILTPEALAGGSSAGASRSGGKRRSRASRMGVNLS